MNKGHNLFLFAAISTLMILANPLATTPHTLTEAASVTKSELTDSVHNITPVKSNGTGIGPMALGNIISPRQAIGLAINNLKEIENGYRLRNPGHMMTFTSEGISFRPLQGGPDWRWRLDRIRIGSIPLLKGDYGKVMPLNDKPGMMSYARGVITEKYLTKTNSVEQQFVIPELLLLNGHELVIEGKVESSGAFESTRGGWLWRNKDGVVSLGDGRVYDATGNELPATMNVTSDSTRIVVNGAAL